jgi:membrane-associated phospholipid phosphatase
MTETAGGAFKAARKASDIGNAITYSIVLAILLSFCVPQAINPWLVFVLTFLVMVFGPGAILAYGIKTGKIDFDVTEQKVRTPYYLLIECCYASGMVVFAPFALPSWVIFNVSLVSVLLNGVMLVINLKWKISAHAAGAAGPATGIAIVFGWWTLLITAPTVAVVIWSRWYLKKHTPAQLVGGTLLAVTIYGLVFSLLYPVALY